MTKFVISINDVLEILFEQAKVGLLVYGLLSNNGSLRIVYIWIHRQNHSSKFTFKTKNDVLSFYIKPAEQNSSSKTHIGND